MTKTGRGDRDQLCFRCACRLKYYFVRQRTSMLKHWVTHINDLNAALDLVPQAMDKFTSSTIIDADSAINTSHNHAIEILFCKSNLKGYIDSHRGLIMSKPLHSTEGV